MKISIIIPCYNCSDTIIRTLDSIFPQLRQEDEIILIDDCSQDDTVETINNYIDGKKNIKLLLQNINKGPANARNLGINVAIGDYLAFIDSDDTVAANYISSIVNIIYTYGADIINVRIQNVFGTQTTPHPFLRYRTQEEYLALSNGSLCSIISSKALWKGLSLPDIRNAEDISVIPVLISRAHCIHQIEEPLYNYIHTNNSLSRKPNPEIHDYFQKSLEFTLAHIEHDKFKESVEFHAIKTIIYGAVLNSIKNNLPQNKLLEMLEQFEGRFPDWYTNKYITQYPLRKRVFLFFVKRRMITCANIFVTLHEIFLKLKSVSGKNI